MPGSLKWSAGPRKGHPEILTGHFEVVLASDEGEADAQLNEELAQMRKKPPFEVAFLRLPCEGQEVEVVRVFEELLRKVGLWRREDSLEVRDGFPLALVETAFDVNDEHIAAPTVLNGALDVPEALCGVLDLVQEHAVVEPRQLCSSLLHNLFFGPSIC